MHGFYTSRGSVINVLRKWNFGMLLSSEWARLACMQVCSLFNTVLVTRSFIINRLIDLFNTIPKLCFLLNCFVCATISANFGTLKFMLAFASNYFNSLRGVLSMACLHLRKTIHSLCRLIKNSCINIYQVDSFYFGLYTEHFFYRTNFKSYRRLHFLSPCR